MKKIILPVIILIMAILATCYFVWLLTNMTIVNNTVFALFLLPLPLYGWSVGTIYSIKSRERKKRIPGTG